MPQTRTTSKRWVDRPIGVDWLPFYFVGLAMTAFLLAIAGVGADSSLEAAPSLAAPAHGHGQVAPAPRTHGTAPARPDRPPYDDTLPGGATSIFAGGRMLVAYYGTAGTGSLGVLGESSPDAIMPRLRAAAAPFRRAGRPAQPVYELIVTLVHSGAGPDGDYSADIARAQVRRYIRAAHRNGVLLLLDLQPGRSDFLKVARRWEWALKDPWVGLALDPEWRMGPHQRPGQVIGSVSAAEVNRVSAWLQQLTVSNGLPEKVFVLHQFRTSMIRHPELVRTRPDLAFVQHVDGYGPPRAKLATLRAVERPEQFRLGFKLFYRQDRPLMGAGRVLRIRPRISFVSFQ